MRFWTIKVHWFDNLRWHDDVVGFTSIFRKGSKNFEVWEKGEAIKKFEKANNCHVTYSDELTKIESKEEKLKFRNKYFTIPH